MPVDVPTVAGAVDEPPAPPPHRPPRPTVRAAAAARPHPWEPPVPGTAPVAVLAAPGRYVQGPGAVDRLGPLTAVVGSAPLVVADDTVWALAGPAVAGSLAAAGLPLVRYVPAGPATDRAVTALAARARATGSDVLVGVGGGSTLDTVKAAGHEAGVRWVCVPTVASTDAPCSAVSVVLDDDGAPRYRTLPRSADVVLVDTRLVAAAPARFLVAGVGDALATWVEARAVARSGAATPAGGTPTLAGTALARLSWDVLHEHAEAAVAAVREHRVTPAVEHVVEATTLLSGVGFESGGLAAAHAVHNGLVTDPRTRGLAHGELVHLGTVAQLVLEGADDDVRDVVLLGARLALPTTLTEVGLGDASDDDLARVGAAATAPHQPVHAMPFEVRPADVVDALRTAEGLARRLRAGAGLPAPVPHHPR